MTVFRYALSPHETEETSHDFHVEEHSHDGDPNNDVASSLPEADNVGTSDWNSRKDLEPAERYPFFPMAAYGDNDVTNYSRKKKWVRPSELGVNRPKVDVGILLACKRTYFEAVREAQHFLRSPSSRTFTA